MALPLATITSYQVYLAVHIGCAVLWVGGGVMLTILGVRLVRARDPQRIADFAADAEWVGTRVFVPLSLLLLIFGFILVSKGHWAWHFWLIWGLVFWALSFLTGAAFLGRQSGKIKKLSTELGPTAPEVQALIARVMLVARIDTFFLFLVVLDMALKPGL